MEITASAVAVYATLALLFGAFTCFVVALLQHRRVRTQGKPALARSLTWSGVGFMLFSGCGFVAEFTAFGRIATGYYIVITLMFILGVWMFLKARELKGK
jgi:NADH:ubiquinone oxidoreductase subunit 3 (subunit A)